VRRRGDSFGCGIEVSLLTATQKKYSLPAITLSHLQDARRAPDKALICGHSRRFLLPKGARLFGRFARRLTYTYSNRKLKFTNRAAPIISE
jgi:hypothetical protein